MPTLRKDLPPLPSKMKDLPLDHRGYPIPWFVAIINGVADFRVIRHNGIADGYRKGLCWICGKKRYPLAAFVIGPMCAVNRVSSEPPSHMECAIFSAMACPFLTRPKAGRREAGLAEIGAHDPAGISIPRNPGVALVWASRDWAPFNADGGGVLFDVGTPKRALWFAEGREATREECAASILSGLPILEDIAMKQGPDALVALTSQVKRAMPLLPAA